MAWIINDNLGNPYSVVINSTDGSWTVTPAPNVSPSQGDNSISITALDLLTSSLRLINVVASGEPVPIDMANDSLMVLNQMLDAWNADRLSIFTTRADDYALISGKQSYTLGIGGDWNTNRPPVIDSMSVILLNNPANPIEIPIPLLTVQQWQTQYPVKSVNSTFPLACYDDGGFPLRTLSFWGIPQEADSIRIYSWQPLGIAGSLQSSVSFPPGYAEAIRYNLAIRLSAEFSAQVSPAVAQIATESLGRIKSANAPDLSLRSDLAPDAAGYRYRADMFGLPY